MEEENSPRKQKKIDENPSESQILNNRNHQDLLLNKKSGDYYSFSTTNKKSSESNPIEQILQQATTLKSDVDSDEDGDEKKKIAAAKKLLFPGALATSFPEIEDTLRNERRQEFCPIYKDETPEAIALRQTNRKPIGSLLAKRIRWDDLKRKRDENERKSQVPTRYGPYGPIYAEQQQYNRNMQNQSQQQQQSFANPYEQYYAAVQQQYEQMTQMNRIQQEYNGFWPGYSQQSAYTYPYASMYFNNTASTNPNIPPAYPSTDYNAYLRQPPPPPPNEPYPY